MTSLFPHLKKRSSDKKFLISTSWCNPKPRAVKLRKENFVKNGNKDHGPKSRVHKQKLLAIPFCIDASNNCTAIKSEKKTPDDTDYWTFRKGTKSVIKCKVMHYSLEMGASLAEKQRYLEWENPKNLLIPL